MKCIMLISIIGLLSCTKASMEATKEQPIDLAKAIAEQVQNKPVLVIEKPVVRTEVVFKDTKGQDIVIELCGKSSMPGYVNGKALDAAISGFNARGSDIDNCNDKIRKLAEKLGAKLK